jgi:hypothetical protein
MAHAEAYEALERALAPQPRQASTKTVAKKSPLCQHQYPTDLALCGEVKDHPVHQAQSQHPLAHDFVSPAKSSKSSGKKRAGLPRFIEGNCSECDMTADMPIHDPLGGYINYHAFVAPNRPVAVSDTNDPQTAAVGG